MSGATSEQRPYLVWVRVDGTARLWRIGAVSEQDARRRPLQDLHRGGERTYPIRLGGEALAITVIWGNVATLEVGPAWPALRR